MLNNPTNLTDPTGFRFEQYTPESNISKTAESDMNGLVDTGNLSYSDANAIKDGINSAAGRPALANADTRSEGESKGSANSEVTSVVKQAGSSIKSFFDGGYGDLAGRAQENGDIAQAIGYVGLGTGYAVMNAVMLGQAGAIANSAKELGGVALNQYEGWALQRITNSVVRTFEEDVAVARSFLSPKELANGPVAPNFGKAVERAVAERVANSPVLGRLVDYTSKPFVKTPDFVSKFGRGVYDVTTKGTEWGAKHYQRGYADSLRLIEYVRPNGFHF